MNTVAVMLVGSLTVSWWFTRNVVRNRPRTSKNFYAVSRDPRGADSDRAGSTVDPAFPTPTRQARDDGRAPSIQSQVGPNASGKNPHPATSEIESPIRKRFLELREETAAIIERYRAMQSQLNEQLARELSSVREQLERLQQDANANLETLDPSRRAGAIPSFFKQKD